MKLTYRQQHVYHIRPYSDLFSEYVCVYFNCKSFNICRFLEFISISFIFQSYVNVYMSLSWLFSLCLLDQLSTVLKIIQTFLEKGLHWDTLFAIALNLILEKIYMFPSTISFHPHPPFFFFLLKKVFHLGMRIFNKTFQKNHSRPKKKLH